MESKEKVVDKIKKLLALSKSPNLAEAESAMNFAQKLIEQYQISATDLEMGDIQSHVYDLGGVRSKLSVWESILFNLLATNNFCVFYVQNENMGRSYFSHMRKYQKKMILVGRQVNVTTCILMFEYLRDTAKFLGKSYPGNIRNSFYNGFVDGIDTQLKNSRNTWGEDEKTALVLTGQRLKKENEEFITQNVGKISSNTVQRTVGKGYKEGFKKGLETSLTRQVKDSQKLIGVA